MKKLSHTIAIAAAFAIVALASSERASAQSASGNPIGFLDEASCSMIGGWSYDPDTSVGGGGGQTPDPGPGPQNPGPGVPQDPGPTSCESRYRWVNINAGTVDQAAGCAAVGAVPAPYISAERGICASGESRPKSGYGVHQIDYSRGKWGGGNGGGGTEVFWQNGGYRCYVSNQKYDKDNTDVAVAYYCDFGDAYPASCPDDNITVTPYVYPDRLPGYKQNNNEQLFFKGLIDAIVTAFRPLMAWAASSDSNSVEIYDGQKGAGGRLLATVPASGSRPDVNAAMGISGNHGFSWSPDDSLRDGNTHYIYAYGTNVEAPGETTELSGSGKAINCAPNFTNSAPSTPSLSCPASGSAAGTPLDISFRSGDSDGNGVRYLIDWDANGSTDEIVPPGGAYAAQNTTQSSSKTWASEGSKTVRVTAQDDQGSLSSAASCTFTLVAGSTEDPVNDPGGDDGGGNGGPGGNEASQGFTVSGTSKASIQFLGDLPATSQPANLSVNPFGGFSDAVVVSVQSIRSVGGADYAGAPVYYFGGEQGSSATMTYDASKGFYVNQYGLIGTSFAVKLPVKITEKHFVTLVAQSGTKTATHVIELDPSNRAPDFQEI
jgi:hypothetical protein